MVFGSKESRIGEDFTPQQIANSMLLSAQEKIDLLNEMKAKVTGAESNDEDYGFSPEEIDEAIADVNRRTENSGNIDLNVPMGGDDA